MPWYYWLDAPVGGGVELLCAHCGKVFIRTGEVRRRRNGRASRPCCSKSCGAKLQTLESRRRSGDRLRLMTWKTVKGHDKAKKVRANALINMRIRRGMLYRPTRCDQRRKRCKPDAHHPDYNKPAEVEWLCRKCHRTRHVVAA